MTRINNIINHIVLVLDASSSMITLSNELVKVADNQIAYLAQRSKELDQETRVTVYQFGSEGDDNTFRRNGYSRPPAKIECLVYDKDVLRIPSIAQVYKAWGNTPLIDATIKALDDLAETPERYGEHSFLVYVLTDGMENDSKAAASTLAAKIGGLPDHWTLAAFVPNQNGVFEAKRFGFPKENIAVWDATTVAGVEEVGGEIRKATENFMQARDHAKRTGTTFRGTRSLFSLEAPSLAEVKQANLKKLHPGQYRLYDVPTFDKDREKLRIDEFVEDKTRRAYRQGEAFYQLSKRELIQGNKKIAILGPDGVYLGEEARHLLGLPNEDKRVSPGDYDEYEVFVQSTSNNRHLMPNTKLLVLS